MAPLLYTAELDLAEADVDAFLRWYAFRHAPDLFPIGFQSCTCYRVLEGDMNLFDLYEIPGPEILHDPRYIAMGPKDPYAAAILEKRRNKAHTVYAQRRIMPDGTGDGPTLDADWIAVLRFDASAAALDEVCAALGERTAALIGRGAHRVRVAERTTDHPRYDTFRPRCMALIEWPERPPPESSPIALLDQRVRDALSNVTSLVGHRLYPWPDLGPRASRPPLT